MINHKIEDCCEPEIHKEIYPISRKEFQRINSLLSIDSYEFWEDAKRERVGVQPDTSEWVFGIEFDNGAKLDWKLCFGDSNCYDDVLFQYPSGLWVDLDCSYELDSVEIDTGSNIYIVELDIQDEQ